eukprot:NODE_804_length_4102_cov_0.255309.p2 type:complete len:321 gc:universal NODE_804_length_4102_cov_0.255309:2740-3702(+)
MNQENQPNQIKRVLADKSNIKGTEFVQGKKRAHAVMFLDVKKPKKRVTEENQENNEPIKKSNSSKIQAIVPISLEAESIKVKKAGIIKPLPNSNQENEAPVDPFIRAPFDEQQEDDDPLMCGEFILSILSYLRKQEVKTLPNDYINAKISTSDRFKIMSQLIEVHHVLRLLPETIFLACNIFDRVNTTLKVSRDQAAAVMLVSLHIASKFEEIIPPTIKHIIKRGLELGISDFTYQKVYDIEQEILKAINYDLSYPNPFNFLRRASKADNYNSETRTVAKYFMELSLVDFRLVTYTPSRLAASAFWCATKMLKKNTWVRF